MENDFNKNQQFNQNESVNSDAFFIFEKLDLSKDELEFYSKELNQICKDFNPFNPSELSQNEFETLKKLDLVQFLDNPFTFTNKTLLLLDQFETKMKGIKN